MIVDKSGSLFEDRRKEERRKYEVEVSTDRRKKDRRKPPVSKKTNK